MMEPRSGWQLSGHGPRAYESYIAQPVLAPGIDSLLEAADIGPGDDVVDLACSTGVVTRTLVERVGPDGHVIAVDVNPDMLSVAQEIAKERSIEAIDWREGDAGSLPLEDDSVDAMVCQQGMQFFPDRLAAMREARRALKPGGRFAFSVLRGIEENPFQRAIAEALDAHVGPDAAAVVYTPFSMNDPEAIKVQVAEAGFRDVHIQLETTTVRHPSLDELVPGYLNATPAAQALAEIAEPTQQRILDTVSTSLTDYLDGNGLAAPLSFHVVSGSVP